MSLLLDSYKNDYVPCKQLIDCCNDDVGYSNCDNVLPIYVGDDRTDEDAFKVILQASNFLHSNQF